MSSQPCSFDFLMTDSEFIELLSALAREHDSWVPQPPTVNNPNSNLVHILKEASVP